MKIVELPAHVTLFLDMDGDNVVDPGEAVVRNQEISWADATANCLLKYVPGPNWYGQTALRYCVSDGTDYGASASVSITVAAVNDAPIAEEFTQAGKLDVFAVNGWTYTDAEGEPATDLKIVGLSSSAGTLFLDADRDGIVGAGEAIQVGQEIAWEDATTNGLVKFAPVVGINESVSVIYSVKDASDYGPTAEAAILAHANNAPLAEPFTETGGSNSAFVIDGWTCTDADGDAPLLVRIESLPENGTLFLDSDRDNVVDAGEAIVAGQDIPWAQATAPAGMVKFSPATNWTGTTAFSYSVDDGWGRGPTADAAIVVESNRAPVALSFVESGREQSVLVVDGWSYTDADGDPAVSIWINSLPANGTLFLDADGDAAIDTGEAIGVGQTIPWADAKTNGLVKFLPAGEWYGSTTFSYSVDDGMAKGSAATGRISVSLNWAPRPGSFWEMGHGTDVVVIDGWSYSDSNSDPATFLDVTELPEHGVLFLDSDGDNVVDPGEAITVNQEINWYDAKTGGLVKFAPDAEWYGITTLTYRVRDWLEYGASGQASIMNNKVTPSDAVWSKEFGYSVSIDGDWAIIGAPHDSPDDYHTGSVYMLHHENGQWVEKQKLFDPIGPQIDCWYYGQSVSIDGDRAIVGEYGSAYVYHFDGEHWVEQQRLTASDGWMWESFGRSVAIDGDHAMVALWCNPDRPEEPVGVYTYRWDGEHWVEEQKQIGRAHV